MAWFVDRQEPTGWWRALNPEVPWLTHAVSDWLELAERPFPERFSWPEAPIWARDRLTGLTTMAILDELETVLAEVPALGAHADRGRLRRPRRVRRVQLPSGTGRGR